MNAPETINIEKYAEALNALVGIDVGYLGDSDENVNAIVEVIRAAKALENRVKELTEENNFLHKTITKNAQMALEVTLDEIENTKADTVRKMQAMFAKRLDISVCGYSTDEVVNDVIETLNRVAEEILEESNNVD